MHSFSFHPSPYLSKPSPFQVIWNLGIMLSHFHLPQHSYSYNYHVIFTFKISQNLDISYLHWCFYYTTLFLTDMHMASQQSLLCPSSVFPMLQSIQIWWWQLFKKLCSPYYDLEGPVWPGPCISLQYFSHLIGLHTLATVTFPSVLPKEQCFFPP